MKKERLLLIFSLILFFQITQAQLIMIDGETGDYKYEDVVNVEGLSQNQIQTRAREWVDKYYQNIDSVRIGDAEIETLISQKITWKFIQKSIPIELFIDLNIQVKDGKYKYAFSNFRQGKLFYGKLDVIPLKTYIERFPVRYQNLAEQPIDEEITKAITSLEFYITNGKMEKGEPDW
jgi:hypothetical protein